MVISAIFDDTHFRKSIKILKVLSFVNQVLDEVVIHASQVAKCCNDGVLDSTFLYLLINIDFILQRVTSKLANSAFSDGIVQKKEV